MHEARARGITVACDNNYRAKLWQYGKTAAEVMPELVSYVDIVISNEEACRLLLGVTAETVPNEDKFEPERFRRLGEKMFTAYPHLQAQAMTLRESYSANHHSWGACFYNGRDIFMSRRYDMVDMVDRVGGRDAFAAGLIYGLSQAMSEQSAIDFAVAASCLKHTIHGDANLATVAEVMELLDGDQSGRVQR